MRLQGKLRNFVVFLAVPLATLGVMIGAAFLLPNSWGIRLAVAVPLILIAALVLMHGYTLPNDYLPKWAKAHGITITDQNRAVVRRYLLRGRRIRSTGAIVGFAAYQVHAYVTEGDALPFGWITATFAGYLLGAAVAEFWAMRPERGAVRAASLTPRMVTDYLPRGAVIGLRLTVLGAAAAAASWPLVSGAARPIVRIDPRPDLGSVIFWAVGSAVLAVFVEATARRVARRPQPASSEELIVVDDAIRSTALHGLYGAGLALSLGALSRIASMLQEFPTGSRLGAFMFMISLLSGLASIFAWLHLGIDQPWVVRRSRRSEAVAA